MFRIVTASLLLALSCALAAGQTTTASAPSGKFTDATESSGIGKVISDNFTKSPSWWISGLYLLDLDGDDHLDFATGAHGGGSPVAALNDGKGHFTLAEGYKGTEIHICADINEDGKLDIQMNHTDGGGRWWINESTPGKVSLKDSGILAAGGQGRVNAMADIDGDGNVDWLHERPGITWELGDGKGGFKVGGNVPTGAVRNESNVYYGDLQGKGFIDLAVHWGRYDNPKGQSRIFFNDGKANFTDATKDAGLSTEDGFCIKGIGDVNQDGFPDLIVLENSKPEIYLNDGKGHFKKLDGAFAGFESATKPHYVSWGLAVVTDFDNDGVADIIWNGRNFLWVWHGTGDGKFKYANKEWGIRDYASSTVDDGLCFGDLDGDGRLDIIGYVPGRGDKGDVRVYHNDLTNNNWINVRPVGAAGNINAAGAKIRIFPAGKTDKPIWNDQVQIVSSQSAQSYYSYAKTERHYGLGKTDKVDVEVEFLPSGKKVQSKGVDANKTVTITEK